MYFSPRQTTVSEVKIVRLLPGKRQKIFIPPNVINCILVEKVRLILYCSTSLCQQAGVCTLFREVSFYLFYCIFFVRPKLQETIPLKEDYKGHPLKQ